MIGAGIVAFARKGTVCEVTVGEGEDNGTNDDDDDGGNSDDGSSGLLINIFRFPFSFVVVVPIVPLAEEGVLAPLLPPERVALGIGK